MLKTILKIKYPAGVRGKFLILRIKDLRRMGCFFYFGHLRLARNPRKKRGFKIVNPAPFSLN
jgi:hypothetical protein